MKEEKKNNEVGRVVIIALSIILLAILGQLLVSCSPRHFVHTESEHSRDTIIRERIVHDTVHFEVPKQIEKVIVRDSVSHLENDYAKSDASIDTLGYLHHSLETIPHTVYVPCEVPVHDTTVIHKDAETIITEIEVEKPLTQWQQLWMALGKVLGLAVVGLVVFKLRRLI